MMRRDLICFKRSRVSTLTPLFIVASRAGLALSLTHARPVQAAMLTVCAIGCEHTSIAAAIAAASRGDTIGVTEPLQNAWRISVNTNLTIQGQGAADTTVDGGGSGPVLTVAAGVNATIQNMTTRNGSATFRAGIGIFGGGTVTLSNSTLSGNFVRQYDAVLTLALLIDADALARLETAGDVVAKVLPDAPLFRQP